MYFFVLSLAIGDADDSDDEHRVKAKKPATNWYHFHCLRISKPCQKTNVEWRRVFRRQPTPKREPSDSRAAVERWQLCGAGLFPFCNFYFSTLCCFRRLKALSFPRRKNTCAPIRPLAAVSGCEMNVPCVYSSSAELSLKHLHIAQCCLSTRGRGAPRARCCAATCRGHTVEMGEPTFLTKN